MRFQGKRPGTKGVGEGNWEGEGNVWICTFSSSDFRGINLSNVRHYYGLRVQCSNDGCLSLSFPSYSIKQTSLQELSWMSLYLVYLYLESLGVVHGDHCEIRETYALQTLLTQSRSWYISSVKTIAQLLRLWTVGRILSRIYHLGEKSWVAEGDKPPRGVRLNPGWNLVHFETQFWETL